MKMRDLTVFSRIEAPIVFNLAGGYREAIGSRKDTVIDTHLATLRCIYRGRTARGFDVHKDHFDDHEAEHRAAFHAWLVTQGFKELTTPEGSYSGSHAQTLWECWEAATLHAKSGGPKS